MIDRQRKRLLYIAMAAGLWVGIRSMTLSSQAQSRIPPPEVIVLSAQTDGLHKAARANGGRFTSEDYVPPRAAGAPNLATLAKISSLIICGKVISSHTELVSDGREIDTVYTISVDQVLKGADPGKEIILDKPGGRYAFPDGTEATQIDELSKMLDKHTDYVLFLQPQLAWGKIPAGYAIVDRGQGGV